MDTDDDKLDEALEETFPASDPTANTPETGIGAPPAPTEPPDRPTPENPNPPRGTPD